MKSLLIIDDNKIFVQELTNKVSHIFRIESYYSCVDLLDIICSVNPDYLVINISMGGSDAVSALRAAYAVGVRPVIIAISQFFGFYQQNAMEELNVAHLMVTPCDFEMAAAVLTELAGFPKEKIIPKPSDHSVIKNLLHSLGLSNEYMGFGCLLEAISIVSSMPDISYTKVLYPDISKKVNSSSKQVERGIRTAIDAAWDKKDENIWRMFFPCDSHGNILRPTNSAFIKTLADILLRQRENNSWK